MDALTLSSHKLPSLLIVDVSVQVISFTLICSMFMCVYKYVAMWVRCHGTAV